MKKVLSILIAYIGVASFIYKFTNVDENIVVNTSTNNIMFTIKEVYTNINSETLCSLKYNFTTYLFYFGTYVITGVFLFIIFNIIEEYNFNKQITNSLD